MKPDPARLVFKAKNTTQKAILNEVSHHLKRGRSPERIAVWMHKPMSVVNQAIQQLRQP